MMDFDHAMNVHVNGNEVKRLAINGVVIWEKYVPVSVNLTSDKTIVTAGDNVCLTATVYDKFNRGCPGKTVDFFTDTATIVASGSSIVCTPGEYTRLAQHSFEEGDELVIDLSNVNNNYSVKFIRNNRPNIEVQAGSSVSEMKFVKNNGIFDWYQNGNLVSQFDLGEVTEYGIRIGDNETCTVDSFTHKSTLIDSVVTDSNGEASVSYSVQGTEPLYIHAKNGMILSEIYVIGYVKDLTSYLTTKSDYEYKSIWTANAGSASNLSMSGNTATLSANATAHHTKEFTDKTHYILEFNGKAGSSLGYDWGFGVGEDSTHFVAMHFQNKTAYFKACTNNQNNASFSKRYQSYVPIKITRNGNQWNININNGELNKDLVSDVEIPNKFFMLRFSWSDMSIKDLKCTIF